VAACDNPDTGITIRNAKLVFPVFLVLPLSLLACSPQSSKTLLAAPASESISPKAHLSTIEHKDGPAHWSYAEQDGPAKWAALSSDYLTCASGREQSPIDIAATTTVDRVRIARKYKHAELKIIRHEHVADVIDNGHTIQVNYDEGSDLQVGDESYELQQYHFHAPSEHTINGQRFPMEMHLVHQSADGALAVLGVVIEEGKHNPAFEPVWANLPHQPGEQVHLEHLSINVDDLLPKGQDTYRYRGSLTTPPCSEGVAWLVSVDSIALSKQQIEAFTVIFQGNNRPVQSLNARAVFVDRVAH